MIEDSQPKVFAERAALSKLLGDSKLPIMTAMLGPVHEANVTQIANLSGVHRTTVHEHLEDLKELNVIQESERGKVGNVTLYTMNDDSPIVQDLRTLREDLMYALVDEEADRRTEVDDRAEGIVEALEEKNVIKEGVSHEQVEETVKRKLARA